LRAVAVGAAFFAKDQAELVLAADPGDGDARIAAVVAADLLRDDDALTHAMAIEVSPSTTLSPLASVLMAELLERRAGPAAKKAWLEALGAPVGEGGDALTRDVAKRH
jgi:uncharacterized protein with PIN domain